MKTSLPIALLISISVFISNSSLAQNVLDNKIYRVTGYKNGNHAIMSTSNYAEVTPPLTIFVPDAFTPNGDGINDLFCVKGEGLQNFTLRIFNRWGQLVFESYNPKQQWDGTYKGKPAQTDTYVYQLIASGLGSQTKTGSVTLVR